MERELPDKPPRLRPAASCQELLEEEISRLIPGKDRHFLLRVGLWLRGKTFLRIHGDHVRRTVTPMYIKFMELDAKVGRDVLDSIGPLVYEQLLRLQPMATEAYMERSIEQDLEMHHGCHRCRHHDSAWDRRGERGEGGIRPSIDCSIYGFIPPVCLDFAETRHCADCGSEVTYDPGDDSGRIMQLTCDACLEKMQGD